MANACKFMIICCPVGAYYAAGLNPVKILVEDELCLLYTSASIILSSTGIGEDMSIPLGLDLSGGVSITYQVVDENPSAEDMSDTIYKLQKRVDSYSCLLYTSRCV